MTLFSSTYKLFWVPGHLEVGKSINLGLAVKQQWVKKGEEKNSSSGLYENAENR